MRVNHCVGCAQFPCTDVNRKSYCVPDVSLVPEAVSVVMISEAAPPDPADHFYARGKPLFGKTTVQAFLDAGADVASMREILGRGFYCTTAVKCGKTGYAVRSATIENCSEILEREIALFPNSRVLMLMGDVAIKAVNNIARRSGEPRVIPAGSTYRLRGGEYHFRGRRVFPSYLQAGPSFFIEKSKRRMIAEDIAAALRLVE